MDTDYLVLLVFLGFVSMLLVWLLLIGPRLRLRKLSRFLLDAGWQEQRPEDTAGWEAFAEAAVAGVTGTDRKFSYTRKVAVFTETVEVHETRRAALRSPVYSRAGRHLQVAACALCRKVRRTRSRMMFPRFWGPAQRSGGTGMQLWRGEMRPFPIRKPVLLYSAIGELAGDHFASLAARQQWSGAPLSELVRQMRAPRQSPRLCQLLDSHAQALGQLRPDVYLYPGGWVLVAPLSLVVSRLADLEAFAVELSGSLKAVVGEMVAIMQNEEPPAAEASGPD